MSAAFEALAWLHAWRHQLPWREGIAFEPLLRRIALDDSVASLARIDTFLDALRTARRPRADLFLGDPAQRNLLRLLAFHAGEVVGRSRGIAPQWFTRDEMQRLHPDEMPEADTFETSLVCRFPPDESGQVYLFAPLAALCGRLFAPAPRHGVAASAEALVPVDRLAAAQQPLPPVPPAAWPVDHRQAIERGGAQFRRQLELFEPHWAQQDPLHRLFRNAPALMRQGKVVWGALVQANRVLFDPRDATSGAPGEVLYDPEGRAAPEALADAAALVAGLRGQPSQDPGIAAVARHLEAETSRVFGLQVPASVSPYPLLIATTWFERAHLPGEAITRACFPVLVSERHPGMALFLPAVFWPPALLQQWTAPRG